MSTSTNERRRDAPNAKTRRRTLLACLECRRRKMRCIPSEQPPTNPCARCQKKGLRCEYVAVEIDDSGPSGSDSGIPPAPDHTPQPHRRAPSWVAQPGPAPPLPYTAAPPPHARPRYSGHSQYPDLSLHGESTPQLQPQLQAGQYYPSGMYNPNQNQGYYNPMSAPQQSSQYMNPAAGMQPRPYTPGDTLYPAHYGQMPYYGDSAMPDYSQWDPSRNPG
ncbi:hypothetical protein R3P38DRAFT_3306360 [Favolaschia claudopus]|uniref:Zn(2)-C6 fungal-type domain-containing protein n=1 Tax=Favolaschia claudopus TaxID=2862362 RepID=A0AAW0DJU6_9AGAR